MSAPVAADEVYTYVCTCPAGTGQASPVTIDIDMPTRTVLAIRVRIPPGPHGQMGFALGSAGANVIPGYHGAPWLVADNEIFEWNLGGLIDSGSWQAAMYNTGIYDHSAYVTFTVTTPPASQPVQATPSSTIAALSAPATIVAPASIGAASSVDAGADGDGGSQPIDAANPFS